MTTTQIPVAAGYTAENLVTASQAATSELSAQSLLVKIFGTIADNPLAAVDGTAGAGDILGNIFMVINLGLLTLGSIYLSYKALAAITQTAHDGEFMGQAFNSVWVPIRITTGIFSLLPIAGGWSIIQVAMLWFGIMGAGLGNIAWNGVVGSGWLPFQTAALSPVSAQPADKRLIIELAKMHICVDAHNADLRAYGMTTDWGVINTVGQPGGGLRFGSAGGKYAECGIVLASGAEVGTGAAYSQRAAARAAANGEFLLLDKAIADRVKNFIADVDMTMHDPDHLDHLPRIPSLIELDQMSHVYDLRSQKAVAGALQKSDAMSEAFRTMRERAHTDGFTTAGAFYLTMANAAHQVNQLAAGVMPTIAATAQPPETNDAAWKYAYRAIEGLEQASQKSQRSISAKDSNSAWKLVMSEMGTDSLGQKIINRLTQDSTGQPVLVRMKNLGDEVVDYSEKAITGIGIAQGLLGGAELLPVAGGIAKAASGAAEKWFEILALVCELAFGFFLSASIFLPMIPFIVFMGQILNWLITVVEGVAAAPFLAFAHLDTDGEGLGQKTQYGYTFMLASFMRPVMLVLGFVFACILLETIGGFVMAIFPMVLADVQQDSMTGFFSILGFSAVFFILMVSLVNSCMSVTYLLPDAIFAFIGAHSSATAQVGRDTAAGLAGSALAGAHAVGRVKAGKLRKGSERHAQKTPGKEGGGEPNGLAAA